MARLPAWIWSSPTRRIREAFSIIGEPWRGAGPASGTIALRLLCIWTWLSFVPALLFIIGAGFAVVLLWNFDLWGPTVITPAAIIAGIVFTVLAASGLAGISIATNRVDRRWRDDPDSATRSAVIVAILWLLPALLFLPTYTQEVKWGTHWSVHVIMAALAVPAGLSIILLGSIGSRPRGQP